MIRSRESIISELKGKGYTLNESKSIKGDYLENLFYEKDNVQYEFKKNLKTGKEWLNQTIDGIAVDVELEIESNIIELNNRVRHINKVEWGIGYVKSKGDSKMTIVFSQYGEIKILEKCVVKINPREEKKGILKSSLKAGVREKLISKVNTNVPLSINELKWLKELKSFDIIAKHYELSNDIAKSSSYWRKANNPERALEITENSNVSSVLTTRGAAYKDISKLEEAKQCAEKSIEIGIETVKDHENFYPYNLLGSIYYHSGEKSKGETYFKKALKRGSSLAMVKSFKQENKKFTDYEN